MFDYYLLFWIFNYNNLFGLILVEFLLVITKHSPQMFNRRHCLVEKHTFYRNFHFIFLQKLNVWMRVYFFSNHCELQSIIIGDSTPDHDATTIKVSVGSYYIMLTQIASVTTITIRTIKVALLFVWEYNIHPLSFPRHMFSSEVQWCLFGLYSYSGFTFEFGLLYVWRSIQYSGNMAYRYWL